MTDGGGSHLISAVCGGDDDQESSSALLSHTQLERNKEEEDDIDKPINGIADFAGIFLTESKKLWYLAAPAIFTSFCQYGLITITQIFAGHLGTTQLAAVSVQNSIISGFPFGMMYGMSSALETYCGQAYGANQHELLGIYMQKSWIILTSMAVAALPLFIFAAPVLQFLGQTESISTAAGNFSLWMIPQQFAYALMLPSTKFLLAQSKTLAIAVIAALALCLHALFSWLLITYLGWGLVGGAILLDGAWWFIAVAQFLYIVAGYCGETWSGFSWVAFRDLWSFCKISVASAVMMCLEVWYVMALTLFAGFLEDAEVSIDALSTRINILGWACTVAIGLNVASSVRVSNELGSRHPKKARLSVIVSGSTSLIIGLIFSLVLIVSRNKYPAIFSGSSEVRRLVEKLTPLLGISIVLTNVQYNLSGVAIGAGWQVSVAYMSSGCYFLFGVPFGVLMAYKFQMGVQGIWYGMVLGLALQTFFLLWMIRIANWNKESYAAEERLRQCRGETCPENETG
ncbi:PREDICTED: protein TRANSPARENT TESTA 12 [Erythranthe guttata]|uniref:protein TRANSPARENT TESTA 12 n=1 Tax=Erythranthe guttata TaxID=4155 RepID=UPI00064E0E5B|nr:PREDICTED: protein TRANSPARENT TESTA 12 [Erythranthe guttata]|eukprot:XP_012855450.1 PREDICTED: protein TRANSPARENT TESTA 12 [Erythranthe guttata]